MICGFVMIGIISRRVVLRSGASAVSALLAGGLASTPAFSAQPASLDQFIDLSRTLTGDQSLDSGMGKNILDAFVAAGQGEDIVTLVGDPAPQRNQAKIANAIVAAWYSGLSPMPGAREVTGFNEALVWTALSFTKPWGSCGGETGYWGEAPPDQEP